MEVDPLDRTEIRIDEDGVDGQGLGLPPLGRLVAAAALHAELHLDRAVLVEVGEGDVGGEDLHIGIRLEIARGDGARSLRLEAKELGPVHAYREDQLAEIHDDVERVLVDPLQMRELVEDALDLGPGGRGPGIEDSSTRR